MLVREGRNVGFWSLVGWGEIKWGCGVESWGRVVLESG